MKRVAAAIVLAIAFVWPAAPEATAQSANFFYMNVPAAPLNPGDSFTVSLFINFVSGGNVDDLEGFSYWLWQSAGTGFPITLTNRDVTGSLFTDLQSALSYPQILDPINRNSNGTTNQADLGALISITQPPLPSGPYFVANLTFQLGAGADGVYTIGNTTPGTPGVGGRFSVITDHDGDTLLIPASSFSIAVVPEPGTLALLTLGLFCMTLARRAGVRDA